jgi:hypothetical protein
VIVIEAPGFARGATDGSVRIDTATHAAKTIPKTARTARILRNRLADRIRRLSHLLAGDASTE